MKLKQAEEPEEELDIEKELDVKPEDDGLDDINSDDDFGNDNYGFDDLGMGDTVPTMEKHNDLLKQLTDFKPFIKEKINGWLGLRWDEDAGKYVSDPLIEPIMNKKCAAWCIDFLKTYTRDNNIITNIGREEYTNIIIDIIDVAWIDIGTRTEDFGIKNNGDLHRICVELQHASELILMGAGGGKYNDLLSTATSRHETINYSGQQGMNNQYSNPQIPQKKMGMMGKLKKALVGG